METVTDFILGDSEITADGESRHEIKTLTPWKKSYNKPRYYIKNQGIILPTKIRIVKAHVWM